MGGAFYSSTSRSVRTLDYKTKSVDQIFEQNKVRKIHASMDPKGLKFRECRDSEVQERSRDNAYHRYRNAINKMLTYVFYKL